MTNGPPKPLRVELVHSPRTFATAEAAIADATATNVNYLAEIGFFKVIGRTVEAVDYDNRSFVWRLSDHQSLVISARENCIGVSAKLAVGDTLLRTGCYPGVLQIESGAHAWNWDRDEIPRSVVGQSISNGFFNGVEFYVYLVDRRIVNFGCFLIHETQEPLLYWQFSD